MKTILKISILLAVIFGMNLAASAKEAKVKAFQGDSVVVSFGNGGRMVIVMKDSSDLAELQEVDFNKLIAEMATYIDSARKSESGTVIIRTNRGEFKIYVEDLEEDDDSMMLIELDGGIYIGKQKGLQEWKEKKKTRRTRSLTDFYIGLNGYLQDGKSPSGSDYELRPLGSRYFEVDFKYETRLGKKDSKLFLNYGLGFSWYNFMLEGNKRFAERNGQIVFEEVPNNQGDGFNLDKTKLTASYVMIPTMLMYKNKNFRFGAGAYAGYRLGSHTKVKYTDESGDTQKDKDSGNFNLSNFRYGLQTEIGVKGLTLFGKYDLNNLFDSDSGTPQLNAFSFGIRL